MYYRMREPRGDELDAMTIHFVRDITRVGRISDSPRGLGGRRLRFNFNTFLYDYENLGACKQEP